MSLRPSIVSRSELATACLRLHSLLILNFFGEFTMEVFSFANISNASPSPLCTQHLVTATSRFSLWASSTVFLRFGSKETLRIVFCPSLRFASKYFLSGRLRLTFIGERSPTKTPWRLLVSFLQHLTDPSFTLPCYCQVLSHVYNVVKTFFYK